MKRLIVFILLFPFNSVAKDYLLEAMFTDWSKIEPVSEVESDPFYSDEAEVYHWELGTPDNIPETIIIYSDEPSPCEL
jgi:hypothetical protein